MNTQNSGLNQGAVLMLLGALAFIGYAVVFLFRNFMGGGFELGVQTLNGVTRDNLNAVNPAIMHYIGHLHVATAGFIAATGIAVAALSWYGVRRGERWAWIAAVVSPVVGLAVALPYHYTGTFQHDWVTHLGPIYVATLVFVVGALLALRAITRRSWFRLTFPQIVQSATPEVVFGGNFAGVGGAPDTLTRSGALAPKSN